MARLYKQNQTAEALEVLLVSTTDGYTAVTGLGSAPVVTLSKAGGVYGAAAGAVSEVGNGVYKVAPAAGDFDTLGGLWVHATGAGAIPYDAEHQVVAFDPRDAVHFGLTALPNAAANAAGGLPISAAGALDLDDIGADVDAIEAKTANLPASPAAVGSAMTLTSGERDAVAAALLDLANGIEASLTVRGAIRDMAAVLLGETVGAGTSNPRFLSAKSGATERVNATMVGQERSSVTTDES